jgi:hypothetical protein
MKFHIQAFKSLTKNAQVTKIQICDGWPKHSVRYLEDRMSAKVVLGKDSWSIPWGLKNVTDHVKQELATLALPPAEIALALSGRNGREKPINRKLWCRELDEGCGFYYECREDVQPLLEF